MRSKFLGMAALCLSPFTVCQASSDTFVHLFEWQWNAIASECENYLAPSGYKAVQVSPPQKSTSGQAWWTRYQPVSYAIEGRSGSRAEFASMVQRCAAVGVDIYVDAVINHMAALNRNFPEVPYGPNDFNSCTTSINYMDAWQVQNCDLVGLNDLKTSSDYVRGKIAAYMNDLTSLGVKGFRIDAAKHIPAADIQNILSRLQGNPYIFQEVIGAPNEPIKTTHYNHLSDVTEFNFTDTIGHYFKGRGQLKDLRNILTWGGWLPSQDAQVFVANHDNQRQNTANIITHKDGNNINQLAHAFLLAYPYGYPSVMSSYDWNDHDQGPPSSQANACNNGWLCEHRQREIANMVGFRKATQSAFYLSNWWDNGGNQIAFGRGDKGFIVINGDAGTITQTLQTGLSAGSYCDVYSADFSNGYCSGNVINVSSNGMATFNVAGKRAVAIHANAKVGETSSSSSQTSSSQSSAINNNCVYASMFVRGTFNNWESQAMQCVNGVWRSDVNFTAASTQYKFDVTGNWATNFGDNNSDGIAESGGNNISYTGQGAFTLSFNDVTKQYSVTPVQSSSSSISSSSVASSSVASSSSSSATTSSASSSSVSNGTVTVTFSCHNGSTTMGQSVYVVGSVSQLGNWAPSGAIKLNPTGYPTWSGSITLPANTAMQWKCLKRSETDPSANLVWQSGGNNSLTTGTSNTSISASF